MQTDFSFPIAPSRVPLAKRWLMAGIAALAIAGLFAILLVLARSPKVQGIIPYKDFFHTALVVHVDLSVLVWFLAVAGALWTLNAPPRLPMLSRSAFGCFAGGTLLLTLSPFLGAGDPLMNNYVPVLQHILFLLNLSVIGCGILLAVVDALIQADWQDRSPLGFGITSTAVLVAAALAAFVLSAHEVPNDLLGQEFYESLFWGGGHILQMAWSQLVAVAWLWLAALCGIHHRLSPKFATVLFAVGTLAGVGALLIYAVTDIDDGLHRLYFTEHMRAFGGLVPGISMLFLIPALVISPRPAAEHRHLYATLLASLLLFAAGGIIAFLINGVNVTIPAHYHGSIVGITLAFMGLTYHLLPQLGFGPTASRTAFWQPIVYAIGQLMHIGGLAWSGGYGVARKSTADVVGIDSVQIAMGIMGMGGLLAIIGGLMFVVVAGKSIFRK
ncbi:MAG: cbb3-type cytochrome c oxidase subunit I [Alphaproteobacteria bacterium]|nr:cbb3-type cytochrome c oxidase subunit I [Alphaproteobacteria bacterium]